MKVQWLVALALSATAMTAQADQCAYVTKQQAHFAAAFAKEGKRIVHFCEPCGDKAFPLYDSVEVESSVVKVLHPTETKLDKTYWELNLNGEGVDLAYVYVERADGSFRNLARLAHCPANGISSAFDKNGKPIRWKPHYRAKH